MLVGRICRIHDADHPAPVQHRDPVRQLDDLVEVLGGGAGGSADQDEDQIERPAKKTSPTPTRLETFKTELVCYRSFPGGGTPALYVRPEARRYAPSRLTLIVDRLPSDDQVSDT